MAKKVFSIFKKVLFYLLYALLTIVAGAVFLFFIMVDEYGLKQPYQHYFDIVVYTIGGLVATVFIVLFVARVVEENKAAADDWLG